MSLATTTDSMWLFSLQQQLAQRQAQVERHQRAMESKSTSDPNDQQAGQENRNKQIGRPSDQTYIAHDVRVGVDPPSESAAHFHNTGQQVTSFLTMAQM